jgi:hypothetical protein
MILSMLEMFFPESAADSCSSEQQEAGISLTGSSFHIGLTAIFRDIVDFPLSNEFSIALFLPGTSTRARLLPRFTQVAKRNIVFASGLIVFIIWKSFFTC